MMGDSEARDRKEKSKGYDLSAVDEEESIQSGRGKKRYEVSSQGQPSSKRRRRWKQEEIERSKRKRENEEVDKVESIFTPEKRKKYGNEERNGRDLHLLPQSKNESSEKSLKFKDIRLMFEKSSRKSKENETKVSKTRGPILQPKSSKESKENLQKEQKSSKKTKMLNQIGEKTKESSKTQPQQHPPFDRGGNSESKASSSLSQAELHHHPLAKKPKPKKFNSAKTKSKLPAYYDYKPISQHFQKVIQTANLTVENIDVQTVFNYPDQAKSKQPKCEAKKQEKND